MAKRKAFKRIVITSKEQLGRIILRFDDTRWARDEEEFIDAVNYIQHPTPAQLLDEWTGDYGIDLCSDGEKKILAEKGKLNSWAEYFAKHWNDDDGFYEWFRRHTWAFFEFYYPNQNERFKSYAAFLRHCRRTNKKPKVKLPWPFPKKGKR